MKSILTTQLPYFKIINECISCYEILLPKGWFLNDYDPIENKIEIEDETTADRFWVEPKTLFRFDLKLHLKMKIADFENKIMYDAYLSLFDGEIRRKRCYLQAFFLRIQKPEIFTYQNFYEKTKDIHYDELYIPPVYPENDDLPF